MKLKQAVSETEIGQARELFEEYAKWLAIDFCLLNFEQELRELPGAYAPPDGRLLLAWDEEGKLMGSVALRRIGPEMCEMKRLYVRTDFRGRGLGRQLAVALIEEARGIGYRRMRLDTLPRRMETAERMYRSLGFEEIEAYYDNPIEGVLYLELIL
jgi:putative acetyltransferase